MDLACKSRKRKQVDDPPVSAGAGTAISSAGPVNLAAASIEDVAEFVRSLPGGVGEFAEGLARCGLDGKMLLSCTKDDLDEIMSDVGITKKAHRVKLVAELTALKDRHIAVAKAVKVEGVSSTAASVAVIEGNIVSAPTAEAASQRKKSASAARLSTTVTDSSSRHIAEVAKLITLEKSDDPEKSQMATDALLNMGVVDEENNINAVKPETISDVVNLLKSGRVLDKEYALIVLRFFACNDANQISFAAAGVIPVLVNLLKSGTAEGKENAAGALGTLAVNDANEITIAAAGAIPPLVELVRSGTPKGKENAAGALWNLAVNDANQITIATAGAIPPLVELVRSGTEEGKEDAAGALEYLANNDANQITIAAAGAIPPLVELVRSGTALGKENAAAALGNLAANDTNKTFIAAAGAIPLLVELVRSGSELGKENAAGALLVLAGNVKIRASIFKAAALPVLINLIKSGSPKAKKCAIDLLSKLSIDHARAVIAADAIPVLVDAAQSCSADVQSAIPRIFANLARSDHSAQIALLMHGALPLLVALLRSGTDNGKAKAAAALAVLAADVKGAQGQVVTSNAPHRAFIVAAGAIPALIDLARSGSGSEAAKGQAARALSELAIDDVNKLLMIDAGAVPVLVDLLRSGTHMSPFINQTAEAVYNLTAKNEDVQVQIAAAGIIPVLKALENPSVRVVRIAELLAILRGSKRVRQAIGGLAF